ncbi:MAG: isochorismatase family protein [Candidatus Cloacimonetes bacterium]|jgi:isochorismate hydrolase|nr:isochorismatase family protein [Candidatus Cloacimonadota bacterium]MDD4156379.1 isochorismatase family protein [Candidatus Cloacimonadota bacterium]
MNDKFMELKEIVNLESISNYLKFMVNSIDIGSDDCIFVMIDIQEKLGKAIYQIDEVIKQVNILNKASELLDIPLIITEQYPKGLGETMKNIYIPHNSHKIEKTKFSIFTNDFFNILDTFERRTTKKPILVLYGIETHICVAQSILEAIKNAYHIILVEDAVSSRKSHSKEIALKLLADKGIEIVTTEMLLFRLLKDAKHPKFKEISNLIK